MLESSEEALAVCRRVDPVYASTTIGTDAQLVENDADGSVLMAMYASGRVTLVEPTTGSIRSVIRMSGDDDNEEEESAHVIGAMSLCNDGSVVTSTLDANLVEIWRNSGNETLAPVRSFKTHSSPIMVMSHHKLLPLLATGSADCSVRVWDSERSYCTHHLQSGKSKRSHHHRSAICSLFFVGTDQENLKLVSGSEDGVLCVWDLTNSLLIDSKQDHSSALTAIHVSDSFLLTAGRDQVVHLYEFDQETSSISQAVMSLAVMEVVESAGIIEVSEDGSVLFYTAGMAGVVRMWKWTRSSASASLVVSSQSLVYSTSTNKASNESAEHGIRRVFYLRKTSRMVITTSEMNVFVLDATDLSIDRMFAGHLGEVTDLNVLSHSRSDGLMAVATNGSDIKLVKSLGSMEASRSNMLLEIEGVLCGVHSQAVLCLASFDYSLVDSSFQRESSEKRYLVVSGSRDNMAVVWMVNASGKSLGSVVLEGHSKEVTAVCVGLDMTNGGGIVVLTGSADSTISVWDLTVESFDATIANVSSSMLKVTRRWSVKGHVDGDVNAVMLTPDGLRVVTAGQDRRACVWYLSDGTRMFEFEGHRRGIWHAALSPTEQIVATASADCTIRIWSLISGQCLRTMEGLSLNSIAGAASVLRVLFAPDGKSLVTASGDGIIRLWDVSTGLMIGSVMDHHMDRVWAMCILSDLKSGSMADDCHEMAVVTGDASGSIVWWKDVRQELEFKHEEQRKQFLLDQQKLANLEYQGQWKDAAHLAVQLDQPFRLYSILSRLIDDVSGEMASDVSGDERIKEVIEGLVLMDGGLVDQLFKYALQWNTSLKRAFVAQTLIRCMLVLIVANGDQITLSVEQRQMLKHFASYTERHNERVNDLMISSHIIDYCLFE